MSRLGHPLGFQTDDLPMGQLMALFDALTTVSNVLCGLRETPMFATSDDYTEAGRMLGTLKDQVNWEIDSISKIAERRAVTSQGEADAKFDILMSGMVWSGDHPAAIVADLAKLSADLCRQVSASTEVRS